MHAVDVIVSELFCVTGIVCVGTDRFAVISSPYSWEVSEGLFWMVWMKGLATDRRF